MISSFWCVGEQLELLSVSINDQALLDTDYSLSPARLTIHREALSRFPASFELCTAVRLCPRENLALSGLYASSADLLCTQCEAMGFRRIAYHLDRSGLTCDISSDLTMSLFFSV